MSDSPTQRRPTTGPVQYKGADLEADRGPGLGCFRFQLIVLAIAIVLTPISVAAGWPYEVSAALLFLTIILLLFAGQTIIFLLRLVAAERRGRRRPLAGRTPTVGELEDAQATEESAAPPGPDETATASDEPSTAAGGTATSSDSEAPSAGGDRPAGEHTP